MVGMDVPARMIRIGMGTNASLTIAMVDKYGMGSAVSADKDNTSMDQCA